ncbi:MAG TPA: anhydro-N-acetylmuramic acid kinase [Rhizobiales bacterium]|nr:anhydro-N-acetylmuramic acid kinase [Hyphomicrobiales bacterium]
MKRAIGMMSGTSMDAIDVAMIETDGAAIVRPLCKASYEIDGDFRALLLKAMTQAEALQDASQRLERPGCLADAEQEVTARHIAALQAFLTSHDLTTDRIDIIGFHGQTVLHRPECALTVQLGDGRELAHQCGIDVVHDFRAADCAAGGQGAPLVPVYHRALACNLRAQSSRQIGTIAFVNIGGVANVTFVHDDNTLVAFDTGPGNALMDDWIRARTGMNLDRDGRVAAGGKVDCDRLAKLLAHDFFTRPPPKSLDRNTFSSSLLNDLSLEDGLATLCSFTATSIAESTRHASQRPGLWIICGGGRHNFSLMRALAEQVAGDVVRAEQMGLDGDGLEAQAFAYLAVRSLLGAPITFPETTGVTRAMSGGVLVRAVNGEA